MELHNIFLLVLVLSFHSSKGVLGSVPDHPNLLHYEVIDSSAFTHRVVKRSIREEPYLFNDVKKVEFSALGREFRLTLNPRHGLLHPEFQAYSVDGSGSEKVIDIDQESFYEGHVDGETSSDVSAHMENGVMTATITTSEDVFYIEPSWRHIPDTKNDSMIAYRGSDVKHSWEDEHTNFKGQKICDYVKVENDTQESDDAEQWAERHSLYDDTDIFFEEDLDEDPKSRVRRQQAADSDPVVKSRCSLLLIADYHFFREMGGSNYKTTVNYIISLIDHVDKIFENTVWSDSLVGNGGFSDMGFVVKKILVHQEPTPVTSNQMHYNMEADHWDVRKLLELHSLKRIA